MSALRYAAIAIALAGGTVAASAQTVTTTTTTVERRAAAPLQLRPEQRTTIYRTVTRERAVATPAGIEVSVGRRVPSGVVLSEFPRAVYVEEPTLEQYRYFRVNNQVVLVDPATSQVVEILDQ